MEPGRPEGFAGIDSGRLGRTAEEGSAQFAGQSKRTDRDNWTRRRNKPPKKIREHGC